MLMTVRDASADDEAFLREVYASTRADELALVPWNEEQRQAFLRFQFDAQQSYYREQFPQAKYQVILDNDKRVGRLYVLREEAEIKILDLAVLPQYRKAGIGTSLVRELLTEAAQTGKTVQIWIEQLNPSLLLFERLGFSKIQEDGYNYLLECHPV